MKILHVTESFGGGVAQAVASYVANTPDADHHLLAATRDLPEDFDFARFAAVRDLPRRPDRAIAAVRDFIRDASPDVIHLHSSWAGLWGRLISHSAKVVYTPHGFAFERQDVSRLARRVYRLAESLLAHRTDALAACSAREAALGSALGHKAVVEVPNLPSVRHMKVSTDSPRRRVVTLGRLAVQKDPEFFLKVVASRAVDSEVTWIGDGDAIWRDALREHGVHVTGWLSAEAASRELSRGGIYVSAAAWEGFPLAVLDAISLGLPLVARRIPAFAHCPQHWQADTPEEVAELIDQLMADETLRERNAREWAAATASHTPGVQSARLGDAYAAPGATGTSRLRAAVPE